MKDKRIWVLAILLACGVTALVRLKGACDRDIMDVYPGESIQAALEDAAQRPRKPIIRVHAGVYRPPVPGEALIHFNARHDGIVLEGVGEVTLTAANPEVADPKAQSYPAIVNHVVYFGDGISQQTVLRNVKITGANRFVQAPPDLVPIKIPEDFDRADRYLASASAIEANGDLSKTHYFYTDGGGILVYARSYPTVENVEIHDNSISPCGGGVSIQHHGVPFAGAAVFRNCVFRNNHADTSGSAVDVLSAGSSVILENCLFVGNVCDEKIVWPGDPRFGAVTVFPNCRAIVTSCTFTDNSAAVHDLGDSVYENTIFWRNERRDGVSTKAAHEINIAGADRVSGCFFSGLHGDPQANISRARNRFDAPDPHFDGRFRPKNPAYDGVGYRP
jgi:hypothetical protein